MQRDILIVVTYYNLFSKKKLGFLENILKMRLNWVVKIIPLENGFE